MESSNQDLLQSIGKLGSSLACYDDPVRPTPKLHSLWQAMAVLRESKRGYESLKSRLDALSGLINGKLDKRLLLAIQNAGSLYRYIYPRRYREVPGYTSPKYFVIAAVCAAANLHHMLKEVGVDISAIDPEEFALTTSSSGKHGDLSGVAGWRVVGGLIDNEVPTYYLDKDLCEELLTTDCTDVKIDWGDFDWPHPAMLLVPPKGLFNNSPLLLGIHWDGSVLSVVGLTEHEADYHQCFVLFQTGRLGSIGKDVLDLRDLIKDRARQGDPKRFCHNKADETHSQANLEEFAAKTVSLVVNAILAMVAEPNFEDDGKPNLGHASCKRKRADPGASWSPNFFKLRSCRESAPDQHDQHDSPGVRVHPRRGHWRTMWKDSAVDEEILVGKRVKYVGDKRLAYHVQSIDGDAITIKRGSHEEVVHRSEVTIARAEPRWFKRVIVGLKSHIKRPSE